MQRLAQAIPHHRLVELDVAVGEVGVVCVGDRHGAARTGSGRRRVELRDLAVAGAKHQLDREKRDDREEEHQPKRCHIACAFVGKIIQGKFAGAQIQRQQSMQDPRIDVEHAVQDVTQHAAEVAHQPLSRLPTRVAVLAKQWHAAVAANRQR